MAKLKIKRGSIKEIVVISILVILILLYIFKNNVLEKMIVPRREDYIKEEINNTNNDNNDIVDDNKNDDEKDDDDKNKNDDSCDGKPSLEEFLAKFSCNACGRHFPLTNPRCGRGMYQQQIKVQEYNQKYDVNDKD